MVVTGGEVVVDGVVTVVVVAPEDHLAHIVASAVNTVPDDVPMITRVPPV